MQDDTPFITATDVRREGPDLRIRVRMLIDGSIVGGMSYVLDPEMRRPPPPGEKSLEAETAMGKPLKRCERFDDLAEELLEGLDLPHRKVRSVDMTHVILEIELARRGQKRDRDRD